MKRVVLGSLLAAVVVFFWGFLYWNVLPFRNAVTRAAPDEPSLAQTLGALPETGTYQLPDLRASESAEAFVGRLSEGPVAHILLRKEGANASDPSMFIYGFLHMLITALLIGLVLRRTGLATFGARFGLVFLAGLAAAIFANLGEPIWYFQPWGWHILQAGYDVTAWALFGLVLAKFVQPEASAARL